MIIDSPLSLLLFFSWWASQSVDRGSQSSELKMLCSFSCLQFTLGQKLQTKEGNWVLVSTALDSLYIKEEENREEKENSLLREPGP